MSGSGTRIEVRTARLRLVALDARLARLQLHDRDAFFTALDARREAAWPPELKAFFSMDRALAALEHSLPVRVVRRSDYWVTLVPKV